MGQMRSLGRFVTRLAVMVPLTAVAAASCGSSGATAEDAGSDSGSGDGQAVEGPSSEPFADTGSERFQQAATDAALPDGSEDAGSSVLDQSTTDRAIEAADGDAASTPYDAPALPFEASTSDGSLSDGSLVDSSEEEAARSMDASDGQVADAAFTTTILGSADRFAIFSGGTVENTAGSTTTVTGDVGTYPSSTAIGPTPPVVVGTVHLADGVARAAATDVAIAYNRMLPSNLPCGTDLTGIDLGGKTLGPGVYCFATTAALTGTLTLDAQHKRNAVWVFQVGSALTTATSSRVLVVNGTSAQACNAFWQITSAATLGTHSVFGGNILAYAAVTVATGTSLVGRAFALTAKVTTDANVISIATCPVSPRGLEGGTPE